MSIAQIDEPSLFAIREGRPTDHAFVLSSWLGGDRFSRAGQACARVYSHEHERVARALLARDGVSLRTACATDDDDALLGWSLSEEPADGLTPCVFYVYVKKGARRLGIASALLGNLTTRRCDYSHQPLIHARDFRAPTAWTYNPYRNHRT